MSASDADLRRFAGFELDFSERYVIRDGRRIRLEPRAFETLAYLVERPGKLVRKRELIDALWPGLVVTDNALTRCIVEIRKALGDDAKSPRYVQTVPRLGYRFIGEALPHAPAGPEAHATPATAGGRRPAFAWVYGAAVLLIMVIGAAGWLQFRDSAGDADEITAAAPPRSIAVLPFLNLSDDPRNSYLSDGLAENLLDLLATIPDLKVVARTSSFAFRDRKLDARTMGRALGVAWLLEGSVQSDGDRLRVTVQLIDATTGYHAWSRRYDRQLTDIFALQDEIATATASVIGSEIAGAVTTSQAPTENLEAYWQYLIGREHVSGRGPGWMRHATAAFSKAVELDEGFAAAHAGLASVLAIEAWFSREGARELLARARRAAERALELDPQLAVAHAAMGLVLNFEDAPPADIEGHYRVALERDPLLIEAHNWLAAFLSEQGRIEESRRQRELALTLDPLNPVLLENRSMNRELAGEYDTARGAALRLLALPHRPQVAWRRLGSVEAAFGNVVAALQAHRARVLELETSYSLYDRGMIALLLARLGLFDEARAWLLHLEEHDLPLGGYFRFNVLARQGDLEGAGAGPHRHSLPPDAFGLPAQKHVEALAMGEIWRQDFDAAIEILAPLKDRPELLYLNNPDQLPGPTEAAQLLALAYLRTGRAGAGGELLATVLHGFEQHEAVQGGMAPGLAYEKAACLGLLGQDARAAETLRRAVAGGWNDWYRARHDVRWEGYREMPWFEEAMALAFAGLERQRLELESLASAGETLAALP